MTQKSIIRASASILVAAFLVPSFSLIASAEDNVAGTPSSENGSKSESAEATEKTKKQKKSKGWNGQWPIGSKKKSDDNDKKSSERDKAPLDEQVTNKENGEEAKIPEAKDKKSEDTPAKEGEKTAADPNRPFSPDAIREYNQGVELQQQGFLNQAIQKYKSALVADDRIERAYCNLGLIYIAQRNFSKASDAFKKAIALKPNNPYSLNGMGSVFYSKGKLQDAMERWQKAVEVDPNFFSAYFNMANAWKNEKDFDKALEHYVMTIKTNPNMAEAYYEIGLIFAKQKHPAQAQTMLARALQLAPEGEFVADAKKQLSGIEGLMGKDDADNEVKMSIVAPPGKEASSEESSK